MILPIFLICEIGNQHFSHSIGKIKKEGVCVSVCFKHGRQLWRFAHCFHCLPRFLVPHRLSSGVCLCASQRHREDGDKGLSLVSLHVAEPGDTKYLDNDRSLYRSCGVRVRSLDPIARSLLSLVSALGNFAQFAVILLKG